MTDRLPMFFMNTFIDNDQPPRRNLLPGRLIFYTGKGENAVRINKYLSDAGACSRREADRLVEAGRVTVGGRTASLGDRIAEGEQVCIDGKPVGKRGGDVLLAFHKPRGIVCTTTAREKNNIVDYIGYPVRIYPVGRLDKDSEGLILMTNQGDLVNRIMRGGNAHEKEYVVRVNRDITPEFVRKMSAGVPILDTVTRPCEVRMTGRRTFSIILTQGLNRQIRRMCEYFGYKVVRLKRIRVMNIELGDLPPGQYREVTGREKSELLRMLRHSSNTTTRYKGDNNRYGK